MPYDNTKLKAVFDDWFATNCEAGFGSVYSRDLLADFNAFVKERRALRASPGPIVFGTLLKDKGLERRRVAGLTHWTGVQLRNPPEEKKPRRYRKTRKRFSHEEQTRKATERRVRRENIMSPAGRRARKRQVQAAMKKETAERNREAGKRDK